MKLVRTALPLALFVALFGCNRSDRGTAMDRDRDLDRNTARETTTTGASVANESAIDRIVAARCEREAACNNIGIDKHFSSQQTCTRDIRSKMTDDLKPSDCPNGIDAKHLDDCLSSIRKEACNNPIDKISRLGSCNTSGLCLDRGERPSDRR